MIKFKCNKCGRQKKIVSKGLSTLTRYGKKRNSDHVCDYVEVNQLKERKNKMETRTQFKSIELKNLSKNNKDILFLAVCFNYETKQQYYVKNGKIALANSFNSNYAFDRENTTFSKVKGIFQLFKLENQNKRILFSITN